MAKNKLRLLILQATESIPDKQEFDAKIIQEILEQEMDEYISLMKIAKNLPLMAFSMRKLNDEERQKWRVQYGSQPRIVYIRHKGSDPSNYERGIPRRKVKRPTINQLEIKEEWNEECAKCPEFDDCQGLLRPCPRYPDLAKAPKDRVLKLEDFE